MLRFGFEHTPKRRTGVEWTPHETHREVKAAHGVQANPMWLWRYVDDRLAPALPDSPRHCSKVVPGEYGNTYGPERPVLRPSKVVHRSGWNADALYLLLGLAPSAGRSMPYANAICDVSFASEPFTPGHRLEQGNAGNQQTWDDRIVVEPHGGNRWEAEVRWLHDLDDYSASRTDEGTWQRTVSSVKVGPYAVVFDSAPEAGVAHWQLVSGPPPPWHQDWVELVRHERRLRVHYPDNFGWYDVRHWDDERLGDGEGRNDVWAVDGTARRVRLSGARAWAVVLLPVRSEGEARVTASRPTRDGRANYPARVGVNIEGADATDRHGAQPSGELCEWDTVITDAELFWVRGTPMGWTACSVNASEIRWPLAREPTALMLDGRPLAKGQEWAHVDGSPKVTLGSPCRTLRLPASRNRG